MRPVTIVLEPVGPPLPDVDWHLRVATPDGGLLLSVDGPFLAVLAALRAWVDGLGSWR